MQIRLIVLIVYPVDCFEKYCPHANELRAVNNKIDKKSNFYHGLFCVSSSSFGAPGLGYPNNRTRQMARGDEKCCPLHFIVHLTCTDRTCRIFRTNWAFHPQKKEKRGVSFFSSTEWFLG